MVIGEQFASHPQRQHQQQKQSQQHRLQTATLTAPATSVCNGSFLSQQQSARPHYIINNNQNNNNNNNNNTTNNINNINSNNNNININNNHNQNSRSQQQQQPPPKSNSTINLLGITLPANDAKIIAHSGLSSNNRIGVGLSGHHSAGYHSNNIISTSSGSSNTIALIPASLVVTAPTAVVVNTNSQSIGHVGSSNNGGSVTSNHSIRINNEIYANDQTHTNVVSSNSSNNNHNNNTTLPNIDGLSVVVGDGGGSSISSGDTTAIDSGSIHPTTTGLNNNNNNSNNTIATKSQLEQLNTMREALFSQDGWGCQHVNQDTNWEVPSSPEPTNKDPTTGAPVMWKPTINNGTDLWESNLRNGGQPTQQQQQVQKTPWGHTPSSNLGGTWGEDDDGTDSSNVWTGSAGNVAIGGGGGGGGGSGGISVGNPGGPGGVGAPGLNNGPQWGQSAIGGVSGVGGGGGGAASAGGGLSGVVSNNSAGGNVPGGGGNNGGGNGIGGSTGNGWGDPRDMRSGGGGVSGPMVGGAGGPMDIRSVDSAIRAASAGDPRDLRILDPRDPIRGDPRGISGRLNGTSEMWGQHHPVPVQHPIQSLSKIVIPGNSGAGGPGGAANNNGGGPTVGGGGGSNLGPGGGCMNPSTGGSVIGGPGSGNAVGGGNVANQWSPAAAAAAAVAAQAAAAAQGVGATGPKDITSMATAGGKPVLTTGWEEPSPPPQRRNIPNYDDGTSLWGQQSRVPGGGSHWKDIADPMNRHLMRNTLGGLNAANCNQPSSALLAAAAVASQQQQGGGLGAGVVGGGGAGGGNPMVGVGGPQGRLTGGPGVGGAGGVSNLVQHKQENSAMWVHPSNSAVTVGRNPGAGGATWGSVDDANAHTVIGGVGSNPGANWTGDDKSGVGGGGGGSAVLGGGAISWTDGGTSSWNKNPTKLGGNSGGGSAVSGWGPATAAAAAAAAAVAAGSGDGNDVVVVGGGGDWPGSGNHGVGGGLIGSNKQQTKIGVGAGGLVSLGLNTDIIKQSKPYRILVDSGYKKDDVERALLSTNMSIDEAAELLRQNATSMVMDTWPRRHDVDGSGGVGGGGSLGSGSYVDHTNSSAGGGGNGGFNARYSAAAVAAAAAAQQSISFPPNNFLNNMGGGVGGGVGVGGSGQNPNLAALNSLQVQKYLSQQGGPHVGGGGAGVGVMGGGGPQQVNAATVAAAFGQNSPNVTAAVNAAAAAAANNNNQPSAQQLRMLVQQIQLAVQSGYLSSQILNQPLAPTTLLLLNQLLTNIKHLQGAQQSIGSRGGNNANNLQLAISKYKQQITTLQNQINTQQAIYIKQQSIQQQQQQQQQQSSQQQQHPNSIVASASGTHPNASGADYLRGHDAINSLQGNFNEIGLNKASSYQSSTQQQSRLNQWKLPVLDKDLTSVDGGGGSLVSTGGVPAGATDFARAPGTTKQSLSAGGAVVPQANNLGGPLGLQTDGTWSSGRSIADGWPDTSAVGNSGGGASTGGGPAAVNASASGNDNENKDWSVQEFEPGKPWKGSQMKNIEDDPSITPGSVARSPLSINPTPKEADIFSNASKPSPTDLPPLSLTSSTWSFNPSTNNQNFPSWSDNTQQCATSELWASPSSMGKPRGPPPGLVVGGSTVSVTGKGGGMVINPNMVLNSSTGVNGWMGGGGAVRGPNGTSIPGGNNWQPGNAGGGGSTWTSNWLLLKNLTAQIDGSTLRTLCMQHGPPITFHLYLNQGIALCKYATREEANKAQMTLNNCVLGNTTICAESPSEGDVQSILQHLPQIQQQQQQQHQQQQHIQTHLQQVQSGGSSVGNANNLANGGNSGGGGAVNNVSAGNNILNGNNANNTATNNVGNSGNGNNGGGQSQATAVSSGGANSGSGVSNGGGAMSASGVASNMNSNATAASTGGGGNAAAGAAPNWRQQSSSQQQQTRPSGRDAPDYDYISKFVCSIVDD